MAPITNQHDATKELHDRIQQQINSLKSEKEQIPKYELRVGSIDSLLPTLTQRFQTRQKLDLQKEKAALLDKIHDLKHDKTLIQLQQDIAPYMQAMRQHDYQKHTSVTQSTLILNDYLSNVQNEGTMVHMEDNETCIKCEVPLIRVTDQSILACPCCGSQSNYLDCSINSLSFQDDHEVQVS